MTDSKITGFDTLSTLRFEGFTERNISELEQILLNLAKSESVQCIKDFYINLHNHIKANKGHDLDISGYETEFIYQLYEVYRRYGNTGSIKDMPLHVEKNVPIATNRDVDAGFNDTKAVTAKQFNSMFQKHLDNPEAHHPIYDALVPDATFTGTPTISLMRYINPNTEVDVTDMWCTSGGTIVIKYTCNTAEECNILTLSGNKNIRLFTENNKLFIDIDSTITELPRYEGLTKDTLVISYKNNKLTIATTKEITEITLNSILDISTVNPYMENTKPTHRFIYYPQSATADEIRFLLN